MSPSSFSVFTLVLVFSIAVVLGGLRTMDYIRAYGKTWQLNAAFLVFALCVLFAIAMAVAWVVTVSEFVAGVF